jgi:hypothetical protein
MSANWYGGIIIERILNDAGLSDFVKTKSHMISMII